MTLHLSATSRAPELAASFRVQVQQITHMSDHFKRITFTGDDLDAFGALGFDQHLHLMFPSAGRVASYGTGPQNPGELSCESCGFVVDDKTAALMPGRVLRAYTVRRASSILRIIDIDFVLHNNSGVATSWVQRARVGDELVILMPPATPAHTPDDFSLDVPGDGQANPAAISWLPGNASKFLLIADETALPAVSAIASELAPHVRVEVLVEVPTGQDIIPIHAGPHVAVHWLPRQSVHQHQPSKHGELILSAVDNWAKNLQWHVGSSQNSAYYVWIAGNKEVVAAAESRLREQPQMRSATITTQTYWQ